MHANSPPRPNLLAVSHEASRTGAVHSLLRLLEWLAESKAANPRTLCLKGGVNLDAFLSTGPTILAKPGKEPALTTLLVDLNVILINSVASARSLPPLSKLGIPIILFVHELNHEINLLSHSDRQAISSIPDHYISCSQAVTENLITQLNIKSSKISTLGELVSVKQILNRTLGNSNPSAVRDQLGLPPETPLIGGSGCPSWRKGTDLFLQTAAAVRKHWENRIQNTTLPHFIWIGGGESPQDKVQYDFEIRRLGLHKMVTFTGSLENPFPLMGSLDAFCLTSREDPYPLVMIEAAALNIPIIGYTGSGGFDEFANEFGGISVDPADPSGMADALVDVLASTQAIVLPPRERLQRLDVETLAPKFFEIINKLTADGRLSSKLDADDTAAELTREHYPVGIRVLSDEIREQDLQMPCTIDKNELIELPIPAEIAKLQKVRLSFNAGPILVCLGDVVVTKSDGEKIIIAHSELTHSAGIISLESHFEVTGHQSHLYFTLPAGSLKRITLEITLRKDNALSTAGASKISSKRLLDRLGFRHPKL